jgi:hypothetical protein
MTENLAWYPEAVTITQVAMSLLGQYSQRGIVLFARFGYNSIWITGL